MNYPDTQFIRAFGILLIINSHLDLYYPIKRLATGGAIGNSIFFFLSAFGIYLSQQKRHKPFRAWIAARLIRIYPSLWIVLITISLPLMLMAGRLNDANIMVFVGGFLDPPYWFIQTLILFYILFYHLLRASSKVELIVILSILATIYFTCYFFCIDLSEWSVEKTPFDRIHYCMIFLFGIMIAQIDHKVKYSGAHEVFIVICLIIVIYGHKFMITRGILCEFQFVQQAAMYPLVYYLLKVSRSEFVLTKIMQISVIANAIRFISEHTLEIYIIHETLSQPLNKLAMPFPLNVVVFLVLTLILSSVVNRLAYAVRSNIN